MATNNPFLDTERRPHTDGLFHAYEVGLSNRNSGLLLETLRHDLTPAGLHYLLSHFDVPYVPDGRWQVEIGGRVRSSLVLALGTSSCCRRAHCASRWNAPATAARP